MACCGGMSGRRKLTFAPQTKEKWRLENVRNGPQTTRRLAWAEEVEAIESAIIVTRLVAGCVTTSTRRYSRVRRGRCCIWSRTWPPTITAEKLGQRLPA